MKPAVALVLMTQLICSVALAQVVVKDPWVRATVPGQQSSGAFMQLTSPRDARLVEVRTPAAAIVEIHEMSMSGNVMRMRAVDGLDLPAGKTVTLSPGGFHVMLMDLAQPLKAGSTTALTLVITGRDGKQELQEVTASVRPLTATPGQPAAHTH